MELMKSMRMSSHSLKANVKALVKLGEIAIFVLVWYTKHTKDQRINQSRGSFFFKSAKGKTLFS